MIGADLAALLDDDTGECARPLAAIFAGDAESWTAFESRQAARRLELRGGRVEIEGEPLALLLVDESGGTSRQLGEAMAIAGIAASLTFDQSMEATLDALAASVVRVTRASACAVTRIDEAAGEFRMVGTSGHPASYATAVETSYRAGANLASIEAFRTRKPITRTRSGYVLQDPQQAAVHDLLRQADWEVLVSVPLLYRGQAVGALTCSYPAGKQPDEADVAFLGVIADQAAVALETARLFDEVQGKAALEERQKLARELHDSVSQALYGIALGARTARALVDRDPSRAAEPIDYVLQLAEAGMAEMRALIFELRPESLEQEGLVAALQKQANALRARYQLGVEALLGEEPDLALAAKEALYRVAQESLHNVVKHARASTVRVAMAARDGIVVLEIADDGKGFEAGGAFPGHLGLTSMRERLERLGGSIAIESAPGHGTRVRAAVPA
jgi:signal transduction histidine kinase